MNIKQFLLGLCLLLGTATWGKAQQRLSLKEAIEIALQNNYDIKLVSNDLEVAKNNTNLGNAGILPNVSVDFSRGGSRQNTVQTQSTGTQRVTKGAQSTNMSYGVGLGWTIFDGFKMFANYKHLQAIEEQGEVNVKSAVITTIGQVIRAYFDLVKQQQMVVAADSAIDVSNMRLKIANNKLQIGRGSKLDVLAAQVDYNTDTSYYLQQKNQLEVYKVKLNELLVRPLDISFQVDPDIHMELLLDYASLADQSQRLNPALQQAIIAKKIAELNLKQVTADRYPRISLNSGYEFNRSASPTGFNTQFRANGMTYGITASMNVFNGFLQRQNERNAKVAIQSSELNIDKMKLTIASELSMAYQNYHTFIALAGLEKTNVEIAKQNLSITLDKYQLGSIPPLELREAQRNFLNVQSRYVDIQYQAKLAEIALKEISGALNIE